ncbi:MAG TPA: PPC domain-containing DNA-binding protein [Candidatus Paceibacterota bacterium]
MRQISIRLKPLDDLKEEIVKLAEVKNIKAGILLSAVGSLSRASLRMAGGGEIKDRSADFEIVSATGTISKNGCHIHVIVSDKDGNCLGGHLNFGSIVRTTVELVILIFDDTEYKRLPDEETGYKELVVG